VAKQKLKVSNVGRITEEEELGYLVPKLIKLLKWICRLNG